MLTTALRLARLRQQQQQQQIIKRIKSKPALPGTAILTTSDWEFHQSKNAEINRAYKYVILHADYLKIFCKMAILKTTSFLEKVQA